MTRPAELASFNVAHSDDAIMHEVAIMHEPHPRDTLKDLTLTGHVITITYFHANFFSVNHNCVAYIQVKSTERQLKQRQCNYNAQ